MSQVADVVTKTVNKLPTQAYVAMVSYAVLMSVVGGTAIFKPKMRPTVVILLMSIPALILSVYSIHCTVAGKCHILAYINMAFVIMWCLSVGLGAFVVMKDGTAEHEKKKPWL